MSVASLVKSLGLVPHPEGGWYNEIWAGEYEVTREGLTGPRKVGATIYYLVDRPHFMCWHKLEIDEAHYWHAGGTFLVHTLTESGEYKLQIGDNLKNEECHYQHVIPHNTWMRGNWQTTPICTHRDGVFPGYGAMSSTFSC
ncbi:hypothetical protein ScPMuIL_013593 [Solemya velum]